MTCCDLLWPAVTRCDPLQATGFKQRAKYAYFFSFWEALSTFYVRLLLWIKTTPISPGEIINCMVQGQLQGSKKAVKTE